jgi:aminoglycoside phosphotransferase (APT) family kinase protein
VRKLERPKAGFSSETVIVDDELVIRLPPSGEGNFPDYDLALQARAIEAAEAAGVPVPVPVRYEPDASFLGSPFMTMPFVAGRIPNDFTPADKWLAGLASDDDRHQVWSSTLDVIARIHTAPVGMLALRTGLADELAYWAQYLDWLDGAPDALRDAFNWCRDNAPGTHAVPSLLWGDVRFGNVVYDEHTLSPKAVLDWDMVSAGPPEMDIAWLTALDAVGFEMTNMTLPGFGTRDDTIAFFEAKLGRRLSDFGWYEVFALVRASAISTRMALLHDRAGQKSMFKVGDDPTLAAAVRRIAAIDT